MNDFSLDNERALTPGLSNRVHLNNAGAALLNERVYSAQVDHLNLEKNIGGYEAAAKNLDLAKAFYDNVSQLINCGPEEVAFVDSATRGWNTFLYSIPFKNGEKIITTSLEFGSNVVSLQNVAERFNLELVVIETNGDGEELTSAIKKKMDDNVRLVAITHAPAHCGTVQDIVKVGDLLKSYDTYYLVDACQTAGQLILNVDEINCDALVATGRKWLRGPRGTGFLYVSNNISQQLNSVSIDLANTDWISVVNGGASKIKISDYAKKFEIWERSISGQIGLSAAILYFNDMNTDKSSYHMVELRKYLSTLLDNLPKIHMYRGDNYKSNVLTFYHTDISASQIKQGLEKNGINVSVIHDWDAPWDFELKNLPPLVRVSPHYYNSFEDLESFITVLKEML